MAPQPVGKPSRLRRASCGEPGIRGELVDTLGVVDVVPPVRPADEAETGTPGAPCLDVAPQVVAQLVGFDPDEGRELPLDRRSSLGADHGQSGADTPDGDFPRSTGRTTSTTGGTGASSMAHMTVSDLAAGCRVPAPGLNAYPIVVVCRWPLLHPSRPVTPEVAGSSPVAPAFDTHFFARRRASSSAVWTQ